MTGPRPVGHALGPPPSSVDVSGADASGGVLSLAASPASVDGSAGASLDAKDPQPAPANAADAANAANAISADEAPRTALLRVRCDLPIREGL
jgi:hypothetical protein